MDHVIIGDHVIIQAGTVIGSDAFYYNTKRTAMYGIKNAQLRARDHWRPC